MTDNDSHTTWVTWSPVIVGDGATRANPWVGDVGDVVPPVGATCGCGVVGAQGTGWAR
jgi:hypothetical protein